MFTLNTSSDIYTVDALYQKPNLASIHILKAQDKVAIIDTGTQYATPHINRSLTELGLNYDHVDYIILTHVHLDHAGGASALMDLCRNAKLIVHPKGARHMADPSKLIAGTSAVYGEVAFKELYGEITAIDANRMIQPADGESIDLNGRTLTFIDTPGHANHHHSIIDEQSRSIFTGDTMGVGYRALRNDDHAFVMISTTPVQFNPQALHDSIDKIMSLKPKTLYLTHYSGIVPTSRIVAGLHEQIEDCISLTEQAAAAGDQMEIELSKKLLKYNVRRCMNEIEGIDEKIVRDWVSMDAKLNAQGLTFWWLHKRSSN